MTEKRDVTALPLFAAIRDKREFIPEGFRDEDGVWHEGPHRMEFDAALANLFLLFGSMTSYAMAPPSNAASEAARDAAVARAKEAMGID